MCIAWKVRQHKLGIDDFGNPLRPEFPPSSWSEPYPAESEGDLVPDLVADAAENLTTKAHVSAVGANVETDSRVPHTMASISDQTPLLAQTQSNKERIWSKWFGR
jgi:hypothetical protein